MEITKGLWSVARTSETDADTDTVRRLVGLPGVLGLLHRHLLLPGEQSRRLQDFHVGPHHDRAHHERVLYDHPAPLQPPALLEKRGVFLSHCQDQRRAHRLLLTRPRDRRTGGRQVRVPRGPRLVLDGSRR